MFILGALYALGKGVMALADNNLCQTEEEEQEEQKDDEEEE